MGNEEMSESFRLRRFSPVMTAVAAVALTTAILSTIQIELKPQHLIIGYIIPTTFVALRYGSLPAILTSIASGCCAAFFLYPPEFSFAITNPLHIAELSFFFLLALATSRFVGGLTDDERVARRRRLG